MEEMKTLKWAKDTFPLLVSLAKGKGKLTYKQLADKLGTNNSRLMGTVLGLTGNMLLSIKNEQQLPYEIPIITSLVVNKKSNLPSDGIKHFYPGYDLLDINQKRVVANDLQQQCYEFQEWDNLLEKIGLQQIAIDVTRQKASFYAGEPESKEHKELKEYVKNNPLCINLTMEFVARYTEYPLKSGDKIDVVFIGEDKIVGVEVKSKKSQPDDLIRGLYQLIKYKYVLEAEQMFEIVPKSVECFLVTENELNSIGCIIQKKLKLNVVNLAAK